MKTKFIFFALDHLTLAHSARYYTDRQSVFVCVSGERKSL